MLTQLHSKQVLQQLYSFYISTAEFRVKITATFLCILYFFHISNKDVMHFATRNRKLNIGCII